MAWREAIATGILAIGITVCGTTVADAAPKEAELTVNRTDPVGFGTGQAEFPLRIAMPGPAFDGTATLVDASGRNQVTVVSVAPEYCVGAERLAIALDQATTATSEWCLKVRGLRPGSEVTGTLSTSAAVLKLKLAVRHNYWFGPALVTLLALGLAAAGVLLGPDRLGGFVRRKRLQAALAKNQQRTSADERGIQGLDQPWVETARRRGVDTTSSVFVGSVIDVIDRGPDRANLERSTLKQHLAGSTLPNGHPLRVGAEQEAGTTTYEVSSFLDNKGAAVSHPASEWLSTIKRAEQLQAKLNTLSEWIERLLPTDSAIRDSLRRRLDAVRTFFAAVDEGDGLDDIEDLADAVLLAINETVGQQVPRESTGMERAARRHEEAMAPPGVKALELVFSARSMARLAKRRTGGALDPDLWVPTLLASGAILAAIAFVMTVAAGSVAASSYATNVAFGTPDDYAKLFLAALASSGVTGVVSTLLLWRPKPKE